MDSDPGDHGSDAQPANDPGTGGLSAATLPLGRQTGRIAFQALVRTALASAAREGWRELILSDASFEDWPLGERLVVDALNRWSAPGRRCILLARRYDEVVRRHARFVAWRRTWDHIIEARRCSQADPLELPSALWTPRWALHRIDPQRSVCVCGSEPERLLSLRELLQEWLDRSTPAFPATTLGL